MSYPASSMKCKITRLSQDCFRRIHNASELIGTDTLTETLNEYMYELKISGYIEKERETILRTFSNLKKADENENRPFNR